MPGTPSQNQTSRGTAVTVVSSARNKGIKFSKSDWIALLDSDDSWKPEKIEAQLTFMKHYKLSFSHSSYEIINKRSKFNYFGFHISNPFLQNLRNFFLRHLVKKKFFIQSYLGKIYK